LPVGEWLGGDMIRCASGDTSFRSWSLSDGISHRLDTEILPPYPECWDTGLFTETFSEGHVEFAGLRDRRLQHAIRSYTHDNDHSSQICGE
jgi:hypothetical protein